MLVSQAVNIVFTAIVVFESFVSVLFYPRMVEHFQVVDPLLRVLFEHALNQVNKLVRRVFQHYVDGPAHITFDR